MVVAIDDNDPMALIRLFNEPVGRQYLVSQGVDKDTVEKLDLLGISGISNLLSAIKICKYYELGENDVLFTVFTDSMELYGSRLEEARLTLSTYNSQQAELDFHLHLQD